MTRKEKNILTVAGLITFLLLMPKKTAAAGYSGILSSLKKFLPSVEGFTAKPIWDYKQWSWGYGTRVPGSVNDKNINPGGTITKDQAWIEAVQVIDNHFSYLQPLITRPLKANQWAALLSFSYNLGTGNADNLVPNINSGNDAALFTQMRKYINAGGVPHQGLINRREKEIALWKS